MKKLIFFMVHLMVVFQLVCMNEQSNKDFAYSRNFFLNVNNNYSMECYSASLFTQDKLQKFTMVNESYQKLVSYWKDNKSDIIHFCNIFLNNGDFISKMSKIIKDIGVELQRKDLLIEELEKLELYIACAQEYASCFACDSSRSDRICISSINSTSKSNFVAKPSTPETISSSYKRRSYIQNMQKILLGSIGIGLFTLGGFYSYYTYSSESFYKPVLIGCSSFGAIACMFFGIKNSR